jgi:diacylglycerol kinase family enzyme
MNQTWYIVLNPAAGKGSSPRRWQELQPVLEGMGLDYTVTQSGYRGHISGLARSAVSSGYRNFLSIGGDGTHHELINGILSTGESARQCTVALVSAGSGNDWARMHDTGLDLEHTARMMQQRKTIPHPAGLIRYRHPDGEAERYFINVAGLAMDGRVVETYPPFFRKVQFLPGYLLAGLRELIRYRAPQMTVTGGDTHIEARLVTVHAGICKYSGGGMQFVPHAHPKNNDLAITCIRRMPKLKLLRTIARLYDGSLLSHPKITGFHCNSVQIHGDGVPIEADGEFLGYTPVEITCIPEAFRLLVP